MALLKRGAAAIPKADAPSAPARPPLRPPTGRALPRWLALFLLVAGVRLAPLLPAQAQTAGSLEYPVKAAFLLNFTRFVEWPAATFPAPDSPMRICVLGEDPFGPILDRIVEGESVTGHGIKAERLPQGGNPRHCHVLFVSRSERERIARIISELRGSSVLTVSELPGFAEAGGVIQFVIEERKVRFYINAAAAEAAGLKLSSRLMKVASAIRGRAPK